MTSYKSTRYRCDHCKKTSGSAAAMRRHERGCTANPSRFGCGMCAAAGMTSRPVAELVAALGAGDADGLAAVREVARGCPACILTAIRQSGIKQYAPAGPDYEGFRVDFDFKKEKEAWWEGVNDLQQSGARYHG